MPGREAAERNEPFAPAARAHGHFRFADAMVEIQKISRKRAARARSKI
jgi:hypothetical protein